MERLSGLDATFLYFETPANHLHVSAVMIFDPSATPGGYSFERVKEFIRGRLHLVSQFRQRLATVPLNLHHPVWFEDPDFDLDYHVRRIAVPAPGGPEELAELAGDIVSRPLDRDRPLWELWIVEGLRDGHVAVVAKMHHSTVDGVSGANLMMYLFDLEAEPGEVPPPPEDWQPEHKPSDLELLAYAARSMIKRPLQAARIVPSTLRAATSMVRLRRDDDRSSGALPLTGPRTSFNHPLTPHRNISFLSIPLDDIKSIKSAFGCTVNDVVLGVCTGALRQYLDEGGELPDKPLVATCPVSVRAEEDDASVGANRVSAMFVSLPVHEPDPVERLRLIGESTRGAKEEHNALGARLLMEWAELAAPNTFALGARVYTRMKLADRHPPANNLVISNVPGPPFPLYFAGARLVALHPLGPIFDGAGLNVTVLSYMDSIGFGFIGCRELTPRLWDLAHHVVDATDELKKAAQAVAPA
jgi:WS/DGAT/MGAT family acyltransferase